MSEELERRDIRWLIAALAAIAVVWVGLSILGDDASQPVVAGIWLIAGLVAIAICVVMVAYTRRWDPRSASVFSVFFAFSMLLMSRFFDTYLLRAYSKDIFINLGRSSLMVGASMMVFAVSWYIVERMSSSRRKKD